MRIPGQLESWARPGTFPGTTIDGKGGALVTGAPFATPTALITPSAVKPQGAASVGTSRTIARADHAHSDSRALDTWQVEADQFEDPDTADWAINGASVLAKDGTNSGFAVRQMTGNDVEGVGFSRWIWTGYGGTSPTSLRITVFGWPDVNPAASRVVAFKLRARGISPTGSPGAWSSAQALGDMQVGSGRQMQTLQATVTLANLGVSGGNYEVQFELTRVNPAAGTNLTGAFDLRRCALELI